MLGASENLANKMRESLKDFFEGVSIKNTLFVIIWTIGIVSWGYFYITFSQTYKESEQVWQSHIGRIENKQEAKDDVSMAPAIDSVQPNEGTAEAKISARPSGIEEIIYAYFKDDYQTAKAVFTAESGLQKDAQGWNCHYGTESRACAPEDREKAWSVDCGVAQINVVGKVCPQELFDPNHNLEVARKKYESRKWQPWCAFTSGKYLAYL